LKIQTHFEEKNKKKPTPTVRDRWGPLVSWTRSPVKQRQWRGNDQRFLTVDKESGDEDGTTVIHSLSRID
jgi:hypothetical protein